MKDALYDIPFDDKGHDLAAFRPDMATKLSLAAAIFARDEQRKNTADTDPESACLVRWG